MKGSFVRNYVSKRGNKVFVYEVTGKPEEVENFKQIQGSNLVEDEETGKPLFFSTRYVGEDVELLITANGKIVADMSAFDKAASLAAQYGGNFGQELASAAAQSLIGQLGIGKRTPSQAPTLTKGVSETAKPVETEAPKAEEEVHINDLDLEN